MIEKLLLILVVIEAVNVIHWIVKSIIDTIFTRRLTKTQNDTLNGQQQVIKLQEEQVNLNKLYSEKQNENIKQLAYLITDHGCRLNELEKILAKKSVAKKIKEEKNNGNTK
ncbi:MAG: hypothetical protein IKS93_04385 [Methanobrevibacter sp.]|nr:hypothetical protein [Methanobrevibacter sp.]